MTRFVTLGAGLAFAFAMALPSFSQVATNGNALLDQLIPDSFKLEANATAAQAGLMDWRTSISYSVSNKSGMNLWMGIAMDSVAIGTCSQAHIYHGGLALLPTPRTTAYSFNPSQGLPRPVMVPSGGRVAGMIEVENCAAPNPGFETAPLSLSLMLGKTNETKDMVEFPMSIDTPIRQIAPQ